MRYWLFKTEPNEFSIDDLIASPKKTTYWDGVRNYQARNFLRDDVKKGDRVLLYHSSTEPSGIVGIATIVREAYPDPTAFDSDHVHFDPKSQRDAPTWVMVDLRFERKLPRLLALSLLREQAALQKMELLRKGSRLSIQPVTSDEFEAILKLSGTIGERST